MFGPTPSAAALTHRYSTLLNPTRPYPPAVPPFVWSTWSWCCADEVITDGHVVVKSTKDPSSHFTPITVSTTIPHHNLRIYQVSWESDYGMLLLSFSLVMNRRAARVMTVVVCCDSWWMRLVCVDRTSSKTSHTRCASEHRLDTV